MIKGFPHKGVALRDGAEGEVETLLWSTLGALDSGVLITDLDHVTLACNARFAEIFRLKPRQAVESNPEQLRRAVAPLILDLNSWLRNLREVYRDPMGAQRDGIRLANFSAPVTRYSAPILNRKGEPIARLWSFAPNAPVFDKHSQIAIDDEMSVLRVGDENIALTDVETRLMRFLLDCSNQTLAKEAICREVWGADSEAEVMALNVYVSRLRKKLEPVSEIVRISTHYGKGYRLHADLGE